MTTPKGMRKLSLKVNETDAVHVYSNPSRIWIQLRRHHPTESDIGVASFKTALSLTSQQAIAIASELLIAATKYQHNDKLNTPKSLPVSEIPVRENHGKPWTPEEDRKLLQRYHAEVSIEEIAKKHKRGVGGVQSRLTKLGKVVAVAPANSRVSE